MPPHASPRGPERRRALPLRPRPERRLPVLAFTTAVLAALVATCYLGGLASEPRLAEPLPPGASDAQPPAYRETGPRILVCPADADAFAERNQEVDYLRRIENERLYEDCTATGHHDLLSALDAASPGDRIDILPGHYPLERTAQIGADLTDLQIEGLGDGPEDVTLSGRFALDTVMDAAGANLYLKGFTLAQAGDTALRLTAAGATVDQVAAFQSGNLGLHVSDATGVLLTGCRADAVDTAGIDVLSSEVAVQDCEVTGSTAGIALHGPGTVADVSGNRLHGNSTGLAVHDTGDRSAITAGANLLYDNNTDHFSGRGACANGPDVRDWTDGALCPDHAYPSGVGLLLADADGVEATGNRIWNQHTAAVAAWGAPGPAGGGNRNTVADNDFGVREDGQRQRNRLDVWWDGTGAENCFDEPGAYRTAPAVLPGCDAAATRILGDPLRTAKAWHCGLGAASDVPGDCDWFGAQFTDRLEFRVAVAFAAVLLFLTATGWLAAARSLDPPRAGQMTFSALSTGAGGLLFVVAVWSGRADYEALAIGLWGFGWFLAGQSWRRSGRPVFGTFTALVGLLAVLDAVDRGVWTVPVVPLAPAWLWLAALPLWTLLALAAVSASRPREPEPPQVERTPVTAPPHDRFDW
ncbi:right-handed parallel beta-helix repeat-containing protein [Glycomyces harbinensis]|uniref:right-handed parallel beta-helix repeat-containing protein n=1 Tax=Glycomyces harbinensis TaxID=58114 RepID=UPI000B84C335|nr:right-handed parallel beta-helix repeat-containing protein [Glycomyces harbinensis]